MSISSLGFLIPALLMAVLHRNNNLLYKTLFLIVNILFVYFSCSSINSFLLLIAYVLFAYLAKIIFKNKTIIYIILVIAFLYLRAYPLITDNFPDIYPNIIEVFAISYVMFRTISYVSSVVKGNIIMYLNYVFSFYTITAGPVEEYDEFEERFIVNNRQLNIDETIDVILSIALGYVKVLCIAYIFSSLSSKYIANTLLMSIFNFWYVYFNFSGYCDVVRGFGKLAGFNIPNNFNKPYLARGIDEFWRKWNIGISSWLREHVYFALGGSKKGKLSTIINTFITFIVSGLWHCFNLNGLVFGLLQAIGVLLFRNYKKSLITKLGSKQAANEYRNNFIIRLFEISITFVFECLSFLFITMEIF